MNHRLPIAAISLLAAVASPAIAQDMTAPAYPETRRGDVVETLFGEEIADPYRWLEEDVRNAPEVADWVERQNAVTNAYLDRLPARDWFRARVGEIFDFARYSTPVERGGRYFYTFNTGLQNQSPLYVREGLEAEQRLLIDPNEWADDGATALSGWRASPDGSKLLYSVQDGGTDWRILRVLDVDTGEPLEDEIRWAKFTDLAWVGEEGFLYSRFPEPEEGEDFQALNYDQAVYFHRLGTPQSEDELVFATPEDREVGHSASVTSDGRWAIITSAKGTDARYEVRAIDLAARDTRGWQARPLVTGFDNAWSAVNSVGGKIWFVTNKDAPLYRVLAIDLDAASPEWEVVVPETEQPIDGASIVGDRLVLSYLQDASSVARIHTLDGEAAGEVELAGIGSVGGFSGRPGNPETFYSFTSFNCPPTIYRLDMATGERSTFAEPELAFDPDDFTVEQRFYDSKDGTRVPMFILRRADVAASGEAVPTVLYGYGGFDISLTPGFSASRLAWAQAGGAFVVANIRGGGEYGKAWHDAGRLDNKQNVFDDFIAAGEFLIAEGITPADGLAIQGGSNGGLLVGAVSNQRPDLFAAGNAAVGVMDMLRFDRWTAGRYWVDDYGYPDREDDFRVLRAYSPLHNIQRGVDYPALLVTTADTDDRVVPGHSFKYIAAVQEAGLGERPQLIRIETRAGHGSGKPTDKAIAEAADIMGFLAYWTGLVAPE
ncbi:prolyl oligopeptidase family serine peptidase [Alteraurantiacibacter aquimixticola]|uniref:prolyl oligopeptidase n=1 Tax=Alteraurantiacibacter aquimixticola TaxID=2489173 RepID=A0A4T3F0F7_9SPHN|nr:prolyl oligopeptidase family serine peptidase [Alteraurantiacibacter aquimixticola]TIX50414.1 S9 family peptidase [Alteraurantiacibacter aquimixticola]